MEKKQMTISVKGLIIFMIIAILVVAIVIMGIHISNQNKRVDEMEIAIKNSEENLKNNISINNNEQNVKAKPTSAQQNDYIILYNGYEIGKNAGQYMVCDGMDVTNETIKKYNTNYYNYENGKYLGESKGIFGTEETIVYDGTSNVGNVKKIATSIKYDVMPRTYKEVNQIPNKIKESIFEYSSVKIHAIDLDGDNKDEYIVCKTFEKSKEEYAGGLATSDIILFDSEYNKIADLATIPDGYWDHEGNEKVFLSLDDNVTYADIDNDGVIEIIIEIPFWEGWELNVYQYKDSKIYGPTYYNVILGP